MSLSDIDLLRIRWDESRTDEEREQATSVLMDRVREQIAHVVYHYQIPFMSRDDQMQEALLYIYTSIDAYDETRGVPLVGYCCFLAKRQMINLLQRSQSKRQSVHLKTYSIDRPACEGDKTIASVLAAPVEQESWISDADRELIIALYQKLSRYEAFVCRHLWRGYSYEDIAKMAHDKGVAPRVDWKMVDNARIRIKKKAELIVKQIEDNEE